MLKGSLSPQPRIREAEMEEQRICSVSHVGQCWGLGAQAPSMCSKAFRQMWVRGRCSPLVPLVCQAQCTGEGVQDFSKQQVPISTPGRLLRTQSPLWARWYLGMGDLDTFASRLLWGSSPAG